MSQTITLYVDGACRGNPGLGGWGAYVITEQGEHKLFGGETRHNQITVWNLLRLLKESLFALLMLN